MNVNIDPRTVGAQVRMRMPLMTPLEARVIDTITGRKSLDLTTSIREVADDAGVSDAMIVKITSRFSGRAGILSGI
mgnify:CR=1 FL=1